MVFIGCWLARPGSPGAEVTGGRGGKMFVLGALTTNQQLADTADRNLETGDRNLEIGMTIYQKLKIGKTIKLIDHKAGPHSLFAPKGAGGFQP